MGGYKSIDSGTYCRLHIQPIVNGYVSARFVSDEGVREGGGSGLTSVVPDRNGGRRVKGYYLERGFNNNSPVAKDKTINKQTNLNSQI